MTYRAALGATLTDWGLGWSVITATPPGTPLQAEAVEVTRSRRIASHRITVTAADRTVAWCQAIAYRTGTWHGDEPDYPDTWRQQY